MTSKWKINLFFGSFSRVFLQISIADGPLSHPSSFCLPGRFSKSPWDRILIVSPFKSKNTRERLLPPIFFHPSSILKCLEKRHKIVRDTQKVVRSHRSRYTNKNVKKFLSCVFFSLFLFPVWNSIVRFGRRDSRCVSQISDINYW